MLQDGIHASTISFPHGSKSWLTTNIPKFDVDIAFFDSFYTESYCGYGIFLNFIISGCLTQIKVDQKRFTYT